MVVGFPPVWFAQPVYYQCLFAQSSPTISLSCSINKQKGVNRMHVAMAHGSHALSIPLVAASLQGKVDGVAISFKENWPMKHWRTLESAYHKAPYFPFYAPDLYPLFREPSEKFLEQSRRHLNLVLSWLRMPKDEVRYQTTDFTTQEFPAHTQPYYPQVFSDTRPFIPGLSILDLFFNVGPEAALFVFSSQRHSS